MTARTRNGPKTVRQLLPVAAGWLREQGLDEPRLDTEHLLAHVLGARRLDLYLDHDRPLQPEELTRFRELMRRRAGREPLAYILGERGFHGLDLEVRPGVLIPRPETERLVEIGLEELRRLDPTGGRRDGKTAAGAGAAEEDGAADGYGVASAAGATEPRPRANGDAAAPAEATAAAAAAGTAGAEADAEADPSVAHADDAGSAAESARPPRFADVGTGSGCVALALLSEHPRALGLAMDVSARALAQARRNAEACGFRDRLTLLAADALAPFAPGALDLVVSNPPYVTPDERDALAPEIRDHEPPEALFDAPGLPITARIAREARRALRRGGLLAIETGYGRTDAVRRLCRDAGFGELRTVADLAGIERIVVGRAPGT